MTMMNHLKSGDYARIVEINIQNHVKLKLYLKGISEGCLFRVISSYHNFIIDNNKKIFAIGSEIAERIRVIHIKN